VLISQRQAVLALTHCCQRKLKF